MSSLKVLKLPKHNTLVIRQEKDSDFFTLSKNSIIITTFNLSALLKFLVFRELLSPKVLQQIVDEWNDFQKG